MAAFFRGLLLFFFGALVGAGGILFFAPGFQVVVSRGDTPVRPVEFGGTKPAPAVAAAPASVPKPTKETPSAQPVVAAQPVAPVVPVASAGPAAPAAPEPALDFAYLSKNLITWPTAVTTKSATTVAVVVDGKKVQDLALEAGALLQLTKVLADGNLEVRAKGAKFEIKSTLTDFTAELAKRVAELVSKGTKLDSPLAASAVAVSAEPAPAPIPEPAAPAPAVAAKPKGPLTLEERVNVLFGKKPAEETPSVVPAPAVPSSAAPAPSSAPVPAAPALPVAPAVVEPAPVPAAPAAPAAPAGGSKEAEKAQDLDRKINQLFK